ncbi:protein COFACTOR ASSEMBLY OF COMPLEX C SUBUNIT B CCB2, chloroplastic isoform X1 [Selaginella moellendorffii]|uniref:protein COFACTOR ASSEMBLY OF COMPLEX C SUBUNIT B CCB2, chloroplastic isoform X1 n=1 Tax=Selaginella moellendorffii TaxID=88036 RepID=UPI000D1CAAB6|nr:protein COFACTOR ASSEMBLY OF COMPLEX C SUBUNIT B CCB2, chloroplastic isoform X1 [Selaginella moellendorffii]|eukprot:XP_024525293.1 protein COFACTOR ASSEMBLY OF COMPLEX C SUBUNIT B CCB2, chloroplastic isoform X1 [Selaginella moellendorffii]
MFLRSAAAGRPGWFSVWEGKCAASNAALPLRGQRKNARLKLRASRDVDVSVLRFTLGIPGFDDSKLPRILGFTFGGLIVVNHIFSQLVPPAQLRSEGVGLFLSVVAVLLPSLRKLELDGQSSRAGSLPSDLSQVFVMAEWLTDAQKQELAWVSYALIRNTKTIAVIAFHGDEIVLARGCWNLPRVDNGDPETPLKILQALLRSFLQELKSKRTIYVPSGAGDSGLSFIPKGLNSLLAQSFPSRDGGLLLVSDVPRAYNVKDRTWIQCLAEKISFHL